MSKVMRFVLGMLLSLGSAGWSQNEGLVAHWTFEEGAGNTLHDRGNSKNDGAIHGADWIRLDGRQALKFNGADSYVDCGPGANLTALTGDITILAWVKLEGSPFPNNNTNWYIVDCETYNEAGYMLRVDGATSKLVYRSNQEKSSQYGFSRVSLDNNVFYCVAVVKKGETATYYVDATPDLQFAVKDPLRGKSPFRLSSPGQSFQGLIDEVRVYNRSLSTGEILGLYKLGAADHGKDTSWFGKLAMSPHPYFDEGKVVVEVNFLGILPLQSGEEVQVDLGDSGGKLIDRRKVSEFPLSGKSDFTFPVASLAAGDYSVHARLTSGQRVKAEASYKFRYPPPPPTVPNPSRKRTPPLPKPPGPVPYNVTLGKTGGFTLTVKGQGAFPVESSFSYPNGGENVLGGTGGSTRRDEADWQVTAKTNSATEFLIHGEGRYYSLDRKITVHPTHVTIRDTIGNKTSEPIGILLTNRLDAKTGLFGSTRVAGRSVTGQIENEKINSNPTLFLGRRDLGLGLIALDDVFIVQSKAFRRADSAGILTDQFALDARASYTLEWAIYLHGTGDYFDFINEVRRDEGRNNVTVEGGFAFIPRGAIPEKGYVETRNLKYLSLSCLSNATDDPQVSLEGIEFMEYPKERAVIRDQFARIRRDYPDLKLMFHVAHSLYANNRPEQRFSDSRVIDQNGKQPVYPYPYDSYGYFSKERAEDNWRWWIYYPTMDNSFGKALLKSADVMVDELGCRGAFMDGFMIAYAGEYTYDRWDRHTAEIDPQTKTLTRKMGSVLLLSQEVLSAFCRKMRAKGATVIANGAVVTRTIGKEPILHDLEITEGPGVHLAPASLCLGNPYAITCESDIHQDVIKKLKAGNLYFYYGEKGVTYPSAPAQMYPITFEELHSGYIKGKERLITIHPGIYGWRENGDLHFGYLYDDRGHLTRHDFVTTVDSTGVRTQVELGADQIAILKRIPITLKTSSAVNLLVERYDRQGIQFVVNGKGKVKLDIRNGDFPLKPGALYRVVAGKTFTVACGRSGALAVATEIRGAEQLRIEAVVKP